MDRSYVAFISYKHAQRDSAIAKEVHTLIENYIVPPMLRKGSRKLGVVFRDEEELPISSDLSDSIQTALRASQYLIVICSPEASASPWVAREIDYFLQTHDANRIFVVLAAGEPEQVFPYAVTHVLNPATGEIQEVEPLALDARADSLRESLKMVRARIRKLYAAMLGCSYDSLVQREKVRRMKRIATLSAALLMVACCFAAVILSKNLELSRKNQELYEATQSILQRESLLLAADAEEALLAGNATEAIQHAAAALDSSEIMRPHCAPAERVLFSALNVYGDADDPILLSTTALTQHSPIESAAFSADGSRVFTIDNYGKIICFDVASGEEIWISQLPENAASYRSNAKLWYDDISDLILCSFDVNLAGLKSQNGEILWLSQVDSLCSVQGPYFDAAHQSLSYIQAMPTYMAADRQSDAGKVHFVSLRTSDGSLQRRVPLFTNTDSEYIDVSSVSNGGMFTDSGRFAGNLRHCKDGVYSTLLYWIDPGANKATIITHKTYANILDSYNYLMTACLDDERVVAISLQNGFDMCCYSMTDGTVLWNVATPMHEDSRYFGDSDPVFLARTSDFLWGEGNCLYRFSKEDGTLLTQKLLDAAIAAIWPLQPGLFGYTLTNGYSAVGWANQTGIHNSTLFSATITLPELTFLIPHNYGLLHADISDTSINDISPCPLQDGGGQVLYLSGDKLTAYVTAVLPSPELPEYTAVQRFGGESITFGTYLDTNSDGITLLSGPSYGDDAYLVTVDATDFTARKLPLDDAASSLDKYLLTKDGQGVMAVNSFGRVRNLGMDGSVTVLSQPEDVSLGTVGDTEYIGSVYQADAARQSRDGSILTARCDGESIHTWIDDQESSVLRLPEDIRWASTEDIFPHRMLRVGENGLLVLSSYKQDRSHTLDSFAVYHTTRREWKLIPAAGHGTEDLLMAFDSESDRFAVYDEDMVIRIYDFASTEPVRCIDGALTAASVNLLGFLPGGRYLYIAANDNQFIVYDTQAGSIVYRTTLGATPSDLFFNIWFDRANSRLYLRDYNDGLCIDVRSWEPLFSIEEPGFFTFYNEAANAVCFTRSSMDAPTELLMSTVPTTAELVQTALDALN